MQTSLGIAIMDLDPPDAVDYQIEAESDAKHESWIRFVENYDLTEDEQEIAALAFYHGWGRN